MSMQAITREQLLKKKAELRAEFDMTKQKITAERQSIREKMAHLAELQGKYRMVLDLLGISIEEDEAAQGNATEPSDNSPTTA